jgi:Protein of unknown function (DUF2752)
VRSPVGAPIPLGDGDLRIAAALLLAAAAARAAIPGEHGVPCPLRTLTGVPCPLCGTTTSVTQTVELDLPEAVAANPAGVGLVALAVAFLLGRGRRLSVRPGLVYFALAAMWLWQLQRFSVI